MPARALIILVLGLLAAWLAAGSLGWLAPPLQKALTWLALATIVIAALAGRRRISASDGLLLGGAASIAVLLTAFSSPVVNILTVAILLAAVAQVRPGSIARVSGPAAVAATALAVFRLACDGSATCWTLANAVGHVEGLWAGWLTGRPLLIGAQLRRPRLPGDHGGPDHRLAHGHAATALRPCRLGHALHRPRTDRISRGSGLQPRPDGAAATANGARFR